MSVLQLSAVKDALKIAGADDDFDLTQVINAAEATIARRCGPLSVTSVTEVVHGGRGLILSKYPLVTVTSITPNTGPVVAVTGCDVFPSGVIYPKDGSGFTADRYTVVYTAGWATLPDDLRQATEELVRHLWATRRGPTRAQSAADGGIIPGYSALLPLRVEQLISEHFLSQAG